MTLLLLLFRGDVCKQEFIRDRTVEVVLVMKSCKVPTGPVQDNAYEP